MRKILDNSLIGCSILKFLLNKLGIHPFQNFQAEIVVRINDLRSQDVQHIEYYVQNGNNHHIPPHVVLHNYIGFKVCEHDELAGHREHKRLVEELHSILVPIFERLDHAYVN